MNAERERAHWDSLVAAGLDSADIRDGDWTERTPRDLKRVFVGDQGPILDLGCGIGRLTFAYARTYRCPVIGVDISPAMLPAAEGFASFKRCDGRTLPWLPSLAGAFSMLMFQHIPQSAQWNYVAQVAERLQPGARFMFQTVIGTEDTFLSHQVAEHQPAQWCEAAGLRVVKVERGDWPEWQWTTTEKLDNGTPGG